MRYISIFICCLYIWGCSGADGETTNTGEGVIESYTITHFNITIAPDLSNRINQNLYPKPVKDESFINIIVDNIYPTILNWKRSENQKDKFSLSFINNLLISKYNVNVENFLLDFGAFTSQRDRIDYIKDRSSGNTFTSDILKFKKDYQNLNISALNDPHGADLWSYLNSRIDDKIIVLPEETPTQFGGNTYRNIYKNILILITDGYIEAGLYGTEDCPSQNTCYFFSKNRINQFRDAFKKSGETDLIAFFTKNNYGIVPLNNPHLNNLEILVLELYDRSLSKGGNATVHPTDKEIIHLFWSDWLSKSKVKNYELVDMVSSTTEAEKVILDFLGVEKRESI